MSAMVGRVTRERYDELVADGLKQIALEGQTQFRLGDYALEIEPMRAHHSGQADPGEGRMSVRDSLARYAEDLDIPVNTLVDQRWVASRWPKQHRQGDVSYTVHKALAAIPDEDERYAQILKPPFHKRSGRRRWTLDEAKRVVGQRVSHPVFEQEKVNKVHDLLADEKVAAQVATDLLRQPTVVARVVEDSTAMHLVNRAQVDRSHRVAAERLQEVPRHTRAAIEHVRQSVRHQQEYIALVGACAAFVAAAGRVVPLLRDQSFTPEEVERVHANLARVRGAADWIETAVDTGNLSMDEGLAALLRGE